MSGRLLAASILLLLITGGLGLVNRSGMSLRALVLAILGLTLFCDAGRGILMAGK
jgi:hypothetical protein